ncbi:RrF2 family transcriptional regulator [Rhodobacteraceae bacterium nBUS_24]
MQLSMFSDYALRVLMHLAILPEKILSTRQISNIHDAKYHHLTKVTGWLVAEGYASSARGRGGGLQLAREPSDINLGELLRKLEEGKPMVECISSDGGLCCLSPCCGLTQALYSAQEAFYDTLDQITLASVMTLKPGMVRLLSELNKSA